jgi:hypothetical protein
MFVEGRSIKLVQLRRSGMFAADVSPLWGPGFFFADHLQTFRPYGAGHSVVPRFYKHSASDVAITTIRCR